MALTKTNGSLTQLTATGNTAAIDLTDAYSVAISLIHVNGTGTITAGAQVQPQISHDGSNYRNDGGPFLFNTTASATEHRTYTAPTDALAVKFVRFAYTAPSGSTGHTFNVEFTKTTGV